MIISKVLARFIFVSIAAITMLTGCVSGEVNQEPTQSENSNPTAAPQSPNNAPPASQPTSSPTTIPQPSPIQSTITPIVQTPRLESTATRIPSPTPTETPVRSITSTPTRTVTPTPEITGLPVQDQMSEAAFRTLIAAFDSGEIVQERNCLAIPELGDLKAEVLRSTREDVEFESYSLSRFPLPYILLLDIERVQTGGYFDSQFLYPRSEEIPGISSKREVVALVNVCSDARIPTALNIEADNMRWTLYVITGS